MQVASLALCRDLYVVSKWDGTTFSWFCDEERDDDPALNLSEPLKVVGGVGYFDHKYPAYDVAFLLAHLPACTLAKSGGNDYWAEWRDYTNGKSLAGDSRTNPANALCHLALALFEARILLP